MLSLNSTPFIADKDDIVNLMLSALPSGYLYRNNEGIKQIIEGFATGYVETINYINKCFTDLFEINADNQFLDRFLAEYGLPNVIFPIIENNEQAAKAISIMRISKNLVSKEDYINFMALLGYEIEMFHLQETIENTTFDYSFPIAFSPSTTYKDKLTWWVLIKTKQQQETDFNNIGDAFPIDFVDTSVDINFAKKILDYIKPDYIIIQYITQSIKETYGLV